jgi:hypothetical protein
MALPSYLFLPSIRPGKLPVDRVLFFFFGLLVGPFARLLQDYCTSNHTGLSLHSTITSELYEYQWAVESLLNTTSPLYLRAAPFVPGKHVAQNQLAVILASLVSFPLMSKHSSFTKSYHFRIIRFSSILSYSTSIQDGFSSRVTSKSVSW